MSGAREKHPLYAAALAADAAWSAEVAAEAKRRRMWPGDLRYLPAARTLPSHATFVAARDAWQAAGFPTCAVED